MLACDVAARYHRGGTNRRGLKHRTRGVSAPMGKKCFCISPLSFLLFFPLISVQPAVAQTVLNFDALSGNEQLIPAGYGGLTWTNMYHLYWDQSQLSQSGFHDGAVSGRGVAFN